MAIYYGTSRVKIIELLEEEQVKVLDGELVIEVPIIELEADGGIEEIREVVLQVKDQN